MKAVLLYRSAPDVMTKAPVYFAAHKERLDAFQRRGELLAVGTWADPREGSMAVFRTRAAAEEFVRDDPFVKNGVVASYEIKDWNEALLDA
jgi:uncharacterized protein YciI